MTKLKTLKDIYGNKANGQISIKDLRQEAIKWIKGKDWNDGALILKLWIKHFFNLTEEDLK
jgi:hypothetical protein